MTQSRTDSLMEALTNTVIGLVISTIANHIILPLTLGVSPTLGQNLVIGILFTAISIVRSYTLRRLFNGKSAWEWLKARWARCRHCKGTGFENSYCGPLYGNWPVECRCQR